jgi:hypothetical protein
MSEQRRSMEYPANPPIRRRYIEPRDLPIDHVWALPYGYWKTEAGEMVLYDRRYHPIFTRRADGIVVIDHPDRFVSGIVEQAWFYRDATAPRRNPSTRAKCEGILARWLAAARSGRPVSLQQLMHAQWLSRRQKLGEAA